jgi:hypothetical protein
MRSLTCLGIWMFIETGGVLNGSVIGITGFTEIMGASVYDAPSSNRLAVVAIGSVTATPNLMLLNESFTGVRAPQYGPDVPGNGAGFGSDFTGFGGARSLTLDFSQTVAAFGATFVHFQNIPDDPSFTFPVTIRVFGGRDGKGTLLGTVTDSAGGVTLQGPAFADFRGLWSTDLNISSAVISGTSPTGGFQVDGFAISITPMPELPIRESSTIVMTTFGVVLLSIWRVRLYSGLPSTGRPA